VTKGSGPPLLLVHGYPQTKAMWHKIAPGLAERFTVVAMDLRGYGASGRPPAGDDHMGYSERRMAADLVEAMKVLGFDRFAARGARPGGRMRGTLPRAASAPSLAPERAVKDRGNPQNT
jgi:haloacetate dehalogenase